MDTNPSNQNTDQIKEKIALLEEEEKKQKDKVEKLSRVVNEGRVKLSREQEKLAALSEKINAQKFFLMMSRLNAAGVKEEDGVKELIRVYETYKNNEKQGE